MRESKRVVQGEFVVRIVIEKKRIKKLNGGRERGE